MMKIALSRNALQTGSARGAALVELAQSAGFDAVELGNESFAPAPIPVVVYFNDAKAAPELKAIKTPDFSIIAGPGTQRGVSRSEAILQLATMLTSAATNINSQLLLTNDQYPPAFLWQVAELIPDSALKLCWDVHAGLQAGHSPFVAIPTLNSRLAIVRLTDTPADGISISAFGDGALPNQAIVERLRGIGYDGWIIIDPPPGDTVVIADWFAAARERLAKWIAPKVKAKAAVKPAAKAGVVKGGA